ncbi:MAG: HAD-IIA family hydrolase [Chloroflexi bacterium]|nr:HAD-IIA family hydrolase [Chloroflexota bacterium]
MNAWSLATVRALVIDADGVLWHGKQNLPGVPAFFDFLRARDIAFIIATNNSARPASEIVERLARMNVRIDDNQVLTSAEATARYLPRLAPRGARVYLVGGQGIADELTRAGFQLVEREADVVVVGIDWQLTYEKLKRASLEIRRGAKFVGTNADKTFPTEDGLVPGAGSLIAAIQTATDVAPTIIGKPERAMFDIALEKIGAPRDAAAMLGDRLDTDIQGAQLAGLKGILVLTGVVTRDALVGASVTPDLVVENLDALRGMWQDAQ